MTLSPSLRLAGLALAAAAIGAVGYLASEHWLAGEPAPTIVETPTGEVPTSGMANSLGKPQVPQVRPDFTLKDLDGKPVSMSQWDGQAVVVNFWATWCGPCQREIPLLNRMHAEYSPKGVQIIGVAVDFAEDVRAFVAKKPLEYPSLVGEEDGAAAAAAFGIESLAFPFTAFTDRQGRVLSVHLGELHEPELRVILDAIVAVNDGKMTLEAARATIAASQERARS
ncbi:MAG: TlpA family protein disulfide reductase [Gammaproteobacteria bacterium]